jgi:predicted helicase
MLLAYYIAALNVEHAYFEITQSYEAFEGLCFVDTLDLAESMQKGLPFLTEANSERVERQKRTPITVIIGNPPYNMGQKNESENNKNRSYKVIDGAIRETYAKDSSATLKNKLYDPYVRFFKWAVDRLEGRPGIVCFVSNNSFVDHDAFDGMQKHLLKDFTRLYHIDLHGDVHKDRTLSGTQHNVFGIQVGVGITLAVREEGQRKEDHSLYYHRVPERWTKKQKLSWLVERGDVSRVDWQVLPPHTWLELENAGEFNALLPLGSKEAKSSKRAGGTEQVIFKTYSVGVLTARDEIVYDFNRQALADRMERFVENYNAEVDRYRRLRRRQKKIDIDTFVRTDRVKWTHNLKQALAAERDATIQPSNFRLSLYRPFCMKWLFFDRLLNERVYLTPKLFPTPQSESENIAICCTSHNQMPFTCIAANCLPNEAVGGRNGQCFSLYTYSEDGEERTENVTDWALGKFREHYRDALITKLDIFNYVYAVLHHPLYRERFAKNLQHEIPRIPMVKGFRGVADIGKKLLNLHVHYTEATPTELEWVEDPAEPISYRVEGRMRLDKKQGTIEINKSLKLSGIPASAFDYLLGTRTALEWIVDQYQCEKIADTGDMSDPNHPVDEQYIVKLIQSVVTVSIETVRLIKQLPASPDLQVTREVAPFV